MSRILFTFFLMTTVIAHAQSNGQYANVNGLRMYYEIHGTGYPLVLIHGGGSTIGTTFGRILGDLAKKSMVIAVEMQAHGHTKDIDRPLSFEQDASDIAALLKELKIDKADLLGFSNGGSTAMQVAIKYPELVRKVIVCSSFYKREGIYPPVWSFIESGTLETMPNQLKEAYLGINPDQKALKSMHDRDRQRMVDFKDWSDQSLKSIKAETLLVIGDKDVVSPEHAAQMSRLIPNCKLAILPGSHGEFLGEITVHTPGSAMPSIFVAIAQEFLK